MPLGSARRFVGTGGAYVDRLSCFCSPRVCVVSVVAALAGFPRYRLDDYEPERRVLLPSFKECEFMSGNYNYIPKDVFAVLSRHLVQVRLTVSVAVSLIASSVS